MEGSMYIYFDPINKGLTREDCTGWDTFNQYVNGKELLTHETLFYMQMIIQHKVVNYYIQQLDCWITRLGENEGKSDPFTRKWTWTERMDNLRIIAAGKYAAFQTRRLSFKKVQIGILFSKSHMTPISTFRDSKQNSLMKLEKVTWTFHFDLIN